MFNYRCCGTLPPRCQLSILCKQPSMEVDVGDLFREQVLLLCCEGCEAPPQVQFQQETGSGPVAQKFRCSCEHRGRRRAAGGGTAEERRVGSAG